MATDTKLDMHEAINENSEQVNAITKTGTLKPMGAASGLRMAMTVDKTTVVIHEHNIGGVDLAFVTASAGDILAGKVGVDAEGNPITGTIETVTASLSGNVVTVPAGHIASKQTLTVAEASAPTVSGNEVTVYKGYQATQKKVTVGVAKSVDTITPGTTDVIIPSGTYLLGMQLIKGDANLLAENIKAGVTIFGITGTYEGSGGGGGGYIFPTDGLLCHFNMNDSGTKAVDDVNGIELTAYGNVKAQESSFRGTAWKASASGDYLAGNNNAFTLPQKFTINAFINYSGNGLNEWRTVVDFGGQNNGEGFGIWLKYGIPAYRIGSSYGAFNGSLTTNSWHMLTMTFNGLSTAMYIDGALTNSISVNKTITNATTINMFKRRNYSDCFYGLLDEVSLWDYAMSEEEVQSLMDYYNNTEEEDTGGSDSGDGSGDSGITTYNYSELDANGDAYVDSDQLSKLFVPVGEKVRIKVRFAAPDKDTIYVYIAVLGSNLGMGGTMEDNIRLLTEDGTVKYTSYQDMPSEHVIKDNNLPNGNYYIEIDNTDGTQQISMNDFNFNAYGDATGISDWVESGGSSSDKTPVYRVTHMNNGEEVGDYWDSGKKDTRNQPIYTNGVCYLGFSSASGRSYIRTTAEFDGEYSSSEYLWISRNAGLLDEGQYTGDYEPGSARSFPYANVEKL